MTGSPDKGNSLVSPGFIALNAAMFLAFCNMAVFFGFVPHLKELKIDPHGFGTLIGLFSLAAVVLQPVISPKLHPGNAGRTAAIGSLAAALVLAGYGLAQSFPVMALIRTIHGLAFALLIASLMALSAAFIPPGRSSQAFGILSVNTLSPYAIIPPLLPWLEAHLGGFNGVLRLTAVGMLLVGPLLLLAKPKPDQAAGPAPSGMTFSEYRQNLADRRVWLLLLVALLFYSGYAGVFYFLKSFAADRHIDQPGLFFTISTITVLTVRLAGGSMIDKLNKLSLMGRVLIALAGGYIALSLVPNRAALLAMGLGLGLGWGLIMPLFFGFMFDNSPPRLRGINSNLVMNMVQAGYFIGPIIWGAAAAGLGGKAVFWLIAATTLIAAGLTPILKNATIKNGS